MPLLVHSCQFLRFLLSLFLFLLSFVCLFFSFSHSFFFSLFLLQFVSAFFLFSFLFAQSFIFERCVAPYFAIFLGIPLLMFCVRHRLAWRVGWHLLACGMVKRYERWVWIGVVVVGTGVAETGASGSGILKARHDGMLASLCGS